MKKLILFFCLLHCLPSVAQKEANIWYFGDKAGIDFNTSPPTALTDGQMNTREGCASIADADGRLLFYTDGISIWNRNHQKMPNGIGLMGHPSSAQSGVIVPMPGSNRIYYIFTASGWTSGNDGYHYSIVDMSLDGGKGDVSTKNVALLTPSVYEGTSAVKHSNNRDIWIFIKNTQGLSAYLLTPSGLQPPVLSTIGPSDLTNGLNMKSSPDGKYVATGGRYYWTLYKFNRTSGQFFDAITFNNVDRTNYGFEFSPNSKILYRSNGNSVFQYSMDYFDSFRISASETTLTTSFRIFALQLGPDKKIYVAGFSKTSLDVIHSPNNLGSSCDYRDNDFDLKGNFCQLGLPNFIQSFFSSLSSYITMPNVFTPNGDGLNDFFLPIEINALTNTNIKIFNRWGEEVYQSTDLNAGWEGKLNGKPLPSATYFWIVNYETALGKMEVQNGIVELIR